jgi:hypothetical protein
MGRSPKLQRFRRAPALSARKTHAGNFAPGQRNATYSVTVSNAAGAGSTSGTIAVIENLPSALRTIAMGGAGWNCADEACARTDSLAGGGSYPVITVTVDVLSNASSQVTNSVTVSGGGSAPASASDPTVIGSAAAPNELLAYRNGAWYADTNRDHQWHNENRIFLFGVPGDIPVMGDRDGSGKSRIGIYRGGLWYVDLNGNNQWDGTGPSADAIFTLECRATSRWEIGTARENRGSASTAAAYGMST